MTERGSTIKGSVGAARDIMTLRFFLLGAVGEASELFLFLASASAEANWQLQIIEAYVW